MFAENAIALQQLVIEFSLTPEQERQLTLYIELLENYNRHTNLVSAQDARRLVSRHIRDSLAFRQAPIWRAGCRLLDLGAGAGFPGIPLKIFEPSMVLLLAESKQRKALFLQQAIDCLRLENAVVLNERAEKVPPGRYSVDLVAARAVAPLIDLWQWSGPFRQPHTLLLALKGEGGHEEARLLQKKTAVDIQFFPLVIDSVPRLLFMVKSMSGGNHLHPKGVHGEQRDFRSA